MDNGISVDDQGGIYVVTSKYMRKVVWNGKKLSDNEADGAWKSEYDYVENTRTIINTDQGRGAMRTMFENPQPNADGSFDVYFGPDAPAGKENQWVKTIPGKGWFTWLRMYGPQETIFDGSYKLPDIEQLD